MFLELKTPPGIYRQGTAQESKGRYYAQNLTRWVDGWLRPVGGWRVRYAAASALSGAARAITAWRANNGDRWGAIGTHSHLYAQSKVGVVSDITPSGFTSGSADASIHTGYGYGPYGAYAYGVPRPDNGDVTPATVWSLDNWGQDLVCCSDADGKIYQWQRVAATPAAVLSNAPTSCQGIVVTDERFLMALAAGGNPRKVQWSDQEDNNVWTPSATNQAGDFELNTDGQLMAGRPMKGRTLLLTSTDAWQAVYQDPTLVYGFDRVGVGCGVIAKGAVVTIDDAQAVWMSADGFWLFNGYTQRIPCEVTDYVFSNLNVSQKSKVTAVHLSSFGEVWWFYPSAASTENDRYVAWKYPQGASLGHWLTGSLARLCGIDKGVFNNPLMVSSAGYIYEHEVGLAVDSAAAYAETGPIELGAGDRMMEIQRLVPDSMTEGDVTATFYARSWPNEDDETFGPYTLTDGPKDFLFQGREVRVRYTFAPLVNGRVGVPKLDIIRGDPI